MAGKGYHNDQFFNLQDESPTRAGNGYKPIVADNPPFTYPSATVRTHDKHGVVTTQMKRGYIRSLVTKSEALSTGIRKCQFQFNPTPLQQSVSMATGMLNILQQDPAQFAQPFASSQNFVFSLMFDRSMEVNNDNGQFVIGDGTDIWRQNSPGQVGVLRDLAALYNTIGEGFSIQQRDYIAKVLKDTAKAEVGSSTAASDAATQYTTAVSNIDASLAGTDGGKGFLDINVGNAGFLLPIPVRVVFSSLYIVEGLVTNTSVVFTKFSSTMVPMQCNVTLTMEAKFIGFSKQHTFFTEVLQQREDLKAADTQAAVDSKNQTIAAFQAACGTMNLSVYSHFNVMMSYDLLLQNKGTPMRVAISHPDATGSANDSVLTLFDGTTAPKVIHGGTITVYGPLPSAVATLPQNKQLSDYAITNGSILATATLVPTSASNGGATSKADWAPFCKLSISKDETHTPTGYSTGPLTFDFNTKYYALHYEGYVQASTGDGVFKGTGDRWVLAGPGSTLSGQTVSQNIPITWPKATVPASGSGTVPPTNVATSTPAAGSTGNSKPKPSPAPSGGPNKVF